MIRIELTSDEASTLAAVCEEYLSELRSEIAHTESVDFRQGLKTKEVFLKEILRRLAATPAAAKV